VLVDRFLVTERDVVWDQARSMPNVKSETSASTEDAVSSDLVSLATWKEPHQSIAATGDVVGTRACRFSTKLDLALLEDSYANLVMLLNKVA